MTGLVTLDIDSQDDVVVASIAGELDLAEAMPTGDAIARAVPTTARGVVVDLSDLRFIDSSGIAMLFGLVRRLGSRRQRVSVVARPGEPVARVLEIVDLSRAASIHSERAAAVAEMR